MAKKGSLEMMLVMPEEMCDTTGEGSIEASQFIAPMTRWVHDSKTAARFNKYNTIRTLHAQEEPRNKTKW